MDAKSIRAAMFNKTAEKQADDIILKLGIKPGDVIADLGSGGGFFTFLFARITGHNGKVYAIDTDPGLLAYIKKKKQNDQISNVETINADTDDSHLPEKSCDLIFLRNVFHHIPHPMAYFEKMKSKLKPNGRIAIVEWKQGARHEHEVAPEVILSIMTDAGYRQMQSFDILEQQSFNIFQTVD